MTGINRRTLFKTSMFAVGATAVPLAAAPAVAVPHAPKVLAKGLQIPWSLTFLPDGNALTGERDTRRVYRILKTGGAKQLVGTVGGGATRLFGLKLSPSYATDNLLFAHVRTRTDARVLAMTYTATAGLGRPKVIFSGIPLGSDHHGGGLVFSPDKQFLFVSVGDKGTPDQSRVNTSLAGKVLRIRLDGSIPADNPFGNAVWAKGFRNVEGMSFDAGGRLWAVEFGEDLIDELDQVVKGGDYGWPTYEGGDGAGRVRDPFVTWSPAECSPAGVAVKNGYAYVGALRGETLFRVKLDPNQREVLPFFQHTFRRIRAVEAAPDGSIWFTTGNNDAAQGFPKVAADDRVVRFLP